MKTFEKYFPIYQKVVEQYENDHPHWRIEVLVSLIKWSLKSLKHYIEDAHDSEITWESPLVELHYPIDWNWKGRGAGDMAPGGHVFGKFTLQNTATKKKAVKTLSQTMARQFNAMTLADLTNWAWFEIEDNRYTPVFPVETSLALTEIKDKRQRRECYEELVRPFSIGAARIDLSGVKPGTPVPKKVLEQLGQMDIRGIRFSGDVNGRKFEIGLVFEIHPMIADYNQRKAYHPVVVGLAVLNDNARFVGGELVQDTPAQWPKKDRDEFWDGLLREMDKLTDLLIPKTESRESVIVSVNSKLKIPAEHWRPENRSAERKKVEDALAQFGEVEDFEVKSSENFARQDVCRVCGWVHDAGFTQIKANQNGVITLGGILPDIVALVHQAHERGFPALSTKDDGLLKVCGGYGNPCKAFDDLNHRSDYKVLFETRKRGFISLRGAGGMNRNKSEPIP
ncbi:MAG: hypothetical protein KGJ60_04550, partial [Verrucomicrobiota bacterium]|nr:hypothetical protein [Verrucomicrobiota bacterium]